MEEKDLLQIKQLAKLCYTPRQVAQIMGIDGQSFLEETQDDESEIGAAYWSGFYETDIAVRESIFDLASKGSSPAQTEARRIIAETERKRHYE